MDSAIKKRIEIMYYTIYDFSKKCYLKNLRNLTSWEKKRPYLDSRQKTFSGNDTSHSINT